MARTTITPQETPGALDYDGADLTWIAGDAVNFNDVAHSGREMILARNDDAGAQSLTVQSAPVLGRERDQTKSIPAGGYAMFGPFPLTGWRQSDGRLWFDVTSANIFVAVLRLPPTV